MSEPMPAATSEMPRLPKWMDRRGLVLGAGILIQLVIALIFQDFRATFGGASAFAARGAPSAFTVGTGTGATESPAAPRRFAAVTPRAPSPAGSTTFGPARLDTPLALANVGNVPAPFQNTPGSGAGPATLSEARNPVPGSFRDLPQGPGASFAGETVSPAPEPGEWVMLILGFGLMAWMLHRHRKAAAQVA